MRGTWTSASETSSVKPSLLIASATWRVHAIVRGKVRKQLTTLSASHLDVGRHGRLLEEDPMGRAADLADLARHLLAPISEN
jgi:hypothetical protein